ncbi:MAG: hypothetical protein A2Z88_03395 [Omnitrophica WOR_2 bacterium GWA2_47_8]|nr:MAG: hypothetical protein A2Z88_03395 [Omnitrophica WOR_2 bacterium GWA2_47_8]
MSQENLGAKAFVAGEDLEAYRRVKLSAGSGTQVEYADAGEGFIGITADKVSQGDFVTVNLKTRGRTFKVVADGVIAVGGSLYGAADGKVSATVSGSIQGTVLEAAAADLEVIEAVLA